MYRFNTLDDLNDKHIERFVVPISFLCVLLIFGIPGNLTVLIIYGTKYSKCVFRVFITNLAVVDLVFCIIGIPFHITRAVHYYTFEGRWVCKLFTAIIVFGFMCSAHLVMLLSVHRFRQICYPVRAHISLRNVWYFIIACVAIGLLLSFPQAVLIDIDDLQVENNIAIRTCPITAAHPSKYSIVYSTFNVCLFSIYTIILFVLYSLIARKMYLQRLKWMRPYTQTFESNISNKMTKIAFTIAVVFALSYIPLFLLKVAKHWFNENDISEVQFELLKIAERLFALSYIPLFLLKVAKHWFNENDISEVEFILLKIAERFYIINHVANPFIYAVFDNRFRRSVRILVSFKRRGSHDEQYKIDHSTEKTASTIVL